MKPLSLGLSIILLNMFLIACAHHRDVRPGAEGLHRVVVLGDNEGDGERNAISQANHYCKEVEGNKYAAFVKEETKYQGQMDEDTHKTVRTASKAAGVVGGGMSVFGGRRESNAGKAIMGAGAVGGVVTNNAYKTEMQFKCQ